MTTAILCDLDGTLCEIGHRLHFVQDGARDWDAFFDAIPFDDLCDPIAEILTGFFEQGEHKILLVSGRPEKCRQMTIAWLEKHDVPYDELYMRPDNDSRPDHVVKAQILDGLMRDGYEPFLVIDDRQSVVDMWREKGLTCLQCAPSDRIIPPSAVLTLMVGPSGSGKTSWLNSREASYEFGIRDRFIISSDDIRADFCGDFRDQSKNEQVFAAIHAMARARLHHGLPTVIDATNIRRRDRMAAAALVEGKARVRYIVIDRPLDSKIKHGGWRNEVVSSNGVGLIERHHNAFQSNLKEILRGDDLPNVQVFDFRAKELRRAA
jgi:predicted kinase